MNVLVTGGAGYIGSHAALRLLNDGHAVTIVDDQSRGNRGAVDALASAGDLHFVKADVGDRPALLSLLGERQIELVMHFAALAYVGESVDIPLRYYRTNTAGALTLLEAMHEAGVNRLVFSSTCATYGEPEAAHIPITERCPIVGMIECGCIGVETTGSPGANRWRWTNVSTETRRPCCTWEADVGWPRSEKTACTCIPQPTMAKHGTTACG